MSASLESEPQPTLTSLVEKELTCAVCLQLYNNPKVLPCLHLYCRDCLVGLKKKPSESGDKKHITCPQCQELHELPENGVDGLKTYFTINNLIEVLKIHEDPGINKSIIVCESGLDEDDAPQSAFARCLTCSQYLCKPCYTVHKKLRLTKDHNVVTLEEFKQSDRKTGAKSIGNTLYCEDHKGQAINMFCKTCKKVICRDCALVKHREHDYAFVHELRMKTQDKLEELMKAVQEKETEFSSHMEHVKNVRKLNKESLASCTDYVEEAYRKILEKLECYRKLLLAEIEDIHNSENKQIDAEQSSLSLALVRFQNSIRFTRQLLDNGDDMGVMSMSVQTEETLETLGKMTWDKEKVKPLLLRVKLDPEVTDLKPFGTVLHKIQPDAIIAKGIPDKVDAGDKVSFQVRLSSEIDYKYNIEEDEMVVTVDRNNQTIPVVVEADGENCWSVSFTPKVEGLYHITITVANTTKAFPLLVHKTDTNPYEVVCLHLVQSQQKLTAVNPASATCTVYTSLLDQNQQRHSVPSSSPLQSPETTCPPGEMEFSVSDNCEEFPKSFDPFSDPFYNDRTVTESRSVSYDSTPSRARNTRNTETPRRGINRNERRHDTPRFQRYNLGGRRSTPGVHIPD